MPVSMAVMELDLSDAPMVLFRNAGHGGLSVVYRRKDGNIGWVDPERMPPRSGDRLRAEGRKCGTRRGETDQSSNNCDGGAIIGAGALMRGPVLMLGRPINSEATIMDIGDLLDRASIVYRSQRGQQTPGRCPSSRTPRRRRTG